MWWIDNARDRRKTDLSARKQGECRQFRAHTSGAMHVFFPGPSLGVREVDDMISALQQAIAAAAPTEIVFDFSDVEMIGPQWTLVLAFLVRFAQAVRVKCLMVSLRGQPAAVVSLYRRKCEFDRPVGADGQTSQAA